MGEGHSKLQEAVDRGQTETVRKWLESSKKTSKKLLNSGLHRAVVAGHADIVELFITHGANVNATANGELGFNEEVVLPFHKGEAVTALHKACLLANAYCLKPLLKSGADPLTECKLISVIGQRSRDKVTPAECVLLGYEKRSEKERSVCLQMLMLKGLTVTWTNQDGDTLLHLAALTMQREICMTLVSQGASVAAVNRNGRTPLHNYALGMANRLGHLMITDVKNPEAEVRRCTLVINNPLRWELITFTKVGISECWGDGVNWFARVGADVNATDSQGFTPLHLACYGFSYHTFFMSFRISALDYAEQCFAENEIYRRFVQVGANLNARDNSGKDPLSLIKDCVGFKIAQKGLPLD